MTNKAMKNRMTKNLCNILSILLIILCVIAPNIVFAAENELGSITINYVDEGIGVEEGEYVQKNIALEGASFSVSLVAVEDNGNYKWIDEIENNLDFVYDTESMFDKNTFEDVAKVLVEIAEAKNEFETYTQIVDKNGQCVFSDLKQGIYLVWESNKYGLATKYHDAVPFFIEIPNRESEPYVLDVVAYPKAEIITEKMVSIIGTKSWKGKDIVGKGPTTTDDNPNEIKVYRPDSITLRLYANGVEVAHTTVTAAQNWSFAFDEVNALDANGDDVVFTIKEDKIKGYIFSQDEAKVGENTIVINVTNTVDESSAQTGDETSILPWAIAIVLCMFGVIVVLAWPIQKIKQD